MRSRRPQALLVGRRAAACASGASPSLLRLVTSYDTLTLLGFNPAMAGSDLRALHEKLHGGKVPVGDALHSLLQH